MEVGYCTGADHEQIKYGKHKATPDARWIILVLPFGLEIEPVVPFVRRLGQFYNVVTWESRLFSADRNQAVQASQVTVEKHVKDLQILANMFSPDEAAILLGYCSGAGIAMLAAAKHPELFSQIILVSGEFMLLNHPDCVSANAKDVGQLLPIAAQSQEKASMVLSLIQQAGALNKNTQTPDAVRLPYSDPVLFHRYALNYESYRNTNFINIARILPQPALVLSGSCDLQTNSRSAQKICEYLAESKLLIIPQGDHYELLKVNETYLDAIHSFIKLHQLQMAEAII